MKYVLKLALVSLFCTSKVYSAEPTASELLKESDRARGSAAVADGLSWDVDVISKDSSGENKVTYALKVKGVDALAETKKGEIMLFNDRNIWFFKTGLKKPVAISPRQKLMGQAANGDIASTNYARDYEGEISGSEKVGEDDTWKLDLKAKAKNVTYDRIRYWIRKKDRLGVKAEFLTVSGEVFKRAIYDYQNKLTTDGKTLPFVSRVEITDAVNQKLKTDMIYKDPKPAKHADSIFNVNNLVR